MAGNPVEEVRQRLEAAEASKQKRLEEQGWIPLLPISEWLDDDDWSFA